jgi:hypothetical protein
MIKITMRRMVTMAQMKEQKKRKMMKINQRIIVM